jgi:hypothetical protein
VDTLATLALSLGAGWASGINLYAAVLTLGLVGLSGFVTLPADLQVLQSPVVLGVAGVMYALNFFADKIPGVDSLNDAVHTFIRIPAGALLAAGAVGQLGPEWVAAAALVGGTLAGGSHITKTGTRALINTSPEPFSNIVVSFLDDIAAIGGLALALLMPVVFLILLGFVVVAMLLLLPRLLRLVAGAFRRLAALGRRP